MNQRKIAQIIPETVLKEMCRQMTPNQLKELAEEGEIIPDQALEMGLITYNQYLQMRKDRRSRRQIRPLRQQDR